MYKPYFSAIVFILLIMHTGALVMAQGGVSLSPAGAPPDSSAALDINFSNKGLLVPRMSIAQRNAIHNPAEGLTIYNTDCHVYNFNAGTPGSPNWATINSSNALIAGVSIVVNPVGAICAGTSVTFSATPNLGNLSPSYQWQVNGNNVGGNSSTYTSSSLNNGDVVTCILSSSVNCVSGSPATSNSIVMLVNSIPGIIQTSPDSFCSGHTATVKAVASAGNINWYSDSTGGSSLATSGSYTIAGLSGTTTYYVDATALGCTTASRTPVTATYYPNIAAEPGVITGPAAETLNATATYSVNPVANAGSYFWTVGSGNITSGQGTDSITVHWDTLGFGNISVVANNACGTSAAQTQSSVGITSNGGQAFYYTGSEQTFTVPNGVNQITFSVLGAQGGTGSDGPGGLGGYATGNLAVSPGEVLYIYVGGQPNNNSGGFNGGGNGTTYGRGGGGASDVRMGGTSLGNRIIIAGGGGGSTNAGWVNTGGSGGGNSGGNGTSSNGTNFCGQGGTQGGGGQGSISYNEQYSSEGTSGQGGNAGTANQDGGGGGGGLYGGGGGDAGGGGGGSGYTGGVSNGAMQNGIEQGNGQIVIVW